MGDNNNEQPLLTRTECNILRGLAILGIVLHNYCHWLGPIVKENEYTFSRHNVDVLGQVLANPDQYLPVHLLSFFGHYGVPVFLFLSAYGLVLKYERHGQSCHNDHRQNAGDDSGKRRDGHCTHADGNHLPEASHFIAYHYLKLFKMMIVGFVAFAIVDAVTPGRWHFTVTQIVTQLGMVNNLLPDPDHNIWPGPYWFFGLMLQLYIVYRLLLCRSHRSVTVLLMAVCVLLQLFMDPEGDIINRYRYNFTGGMLPFGLGLLLARHTGAAHNLRLTAPQTFVGFVLSSLMVYSCSLTFCLWAVAPAFVCAAAVFLVKWMGSWPRMLKPFTIDILNWTGAISAALFVSHPILRKVFIPISRGGDVYTGLLLYAMASLCVAWVFRELMKKIPNPRLE